MSYLIAFLAASAIVWAFVRSRSKETPKGGGVLPPSDPPKDHDEITPPRLD